MFPRRALYHPYKSSAPSSPAGFRIPDCISPRRCFNLFQGPNFTNAGSPAPSPLNSPVKGSHHPRDDPPPTIRLGDLFGRNGGLESPQRPSTPAPDHPRNAIPNGQKTNPVPDQDPFPVPPRRKANRGPKHLSFNNNGVHHPRYRAQPLKEKRKIFGRHERRVVRARESLSRLRREAETLMKPEHMDEEDRIFLKQLQALQLDQTLKHDLEQCRQRMSRAAGESEKRRQEHEKRDEEAAKMCGERRDEEALEKQKRKVDAFVRAKEEGQEARRRLMEEAAMGADEERQRAHEALERAIREAQERLFREELARKAKQEEERRRREEHERRIREERERQLREERERRRQEERERMLREEVERLRREAHERFLRQDRERLAREERERQARILAEQARRVAEEDQARQHFVLYEGKWNELRNSNPLPPIDVQEMPWPVFGVVSSADQITYQDVRTFLFHPLRPGVEGKTARDKVKLEVLRFHPDKFNARVLPKIQPSQRAVAQEIAGAIARILTRIMTEEVENQK